MIIHPFTIDDPQWPGKLFVINDNQAIGPAGSQPLRRVVEEPIEKGRALVKMEAVSGVEDRPLASPLGRKPPEPGRHWGVHMDGIIAVPLKQSFQLPIGLEVLKASSLASEWYIPTGYSYGLPLFFAASSRRGRQRGSAEHVPGPGRTSPAGRWP